MGRAGRVVAAAVAAATLAACRSGAPSVDHRQIEKQLVDSVKEQKPDVAATGTCPTGIKARKGATFECHLRLGADDVRYTVTISDVHGAQYGAETRPTQPVLDTSVIASTVRQEAGGEPAGASVGCGPHRFVQLAVLGTLICTVSRAGQTSAVAATITDDAGDVSFAAGPPGAVAGATSAPPPGGAPAPPPTTTKAPSLPGD